MRNGVIGKANGHAHRKVVAFRLFFPVVVNSRERTVNRCQCKQHRCICTELTRTHDWKAAQNSLKYSMSKCSIPLCVVRECVGVSFFLCVCVCVGAALAHILMGFACCRLQWWSITFSSQEAQRSNTINFVEVNAVWHLSVKLLSLKSHWFVPSMCVSAINKWMHSLVHCMVFFYFYIERIMKFISKTSMKFHSIGIQWISNENLVRIYIQQPYSPVSFHKNSQIFRNRKRLYHFFKKMPCYLTLLLFSRIFFSMANKIESCQKIRYSFNFVIFHSIFS